MSPQRELDLTVLLQGVVPEDQLGLHRGFEQLEASGELASYSAFPYRSLRSAFEWGQYFAAVLEHMRSTGSTALLCQFFHSPDIPDPRPFLEEVARLPQRPVIATSCGDGFGSMLWPPPESLARACSRSDISFVTAMGGLAEKLHKAGARRITLMPLSACDERFGLRPAAVETVEPEFDVVFIGSRPGGRNPTKGLYWSGKKRSAAVERLNKRYGSRFGLFGHGWAGLRAWQGPSAFADQVAVCHRGLVVYGGYPGSLSDYYASNRPFIQALSGRPVVDHYVPRVDTLLAEGSEWILARDTDETVRLIDQLLETPTTAVDIGSCGARAVAARHMDSHRTALMVSIMSEVYNARIQGREATCPPLDFFHAGVDVPSQMMAAVKAW